MERPLAGGGLNGSRSDFSMQTEPAPNALVRKLSAYSSLAFDDVALLSSMLSERVRNVGPRQDIVREGDPPEPPIIILKGWGYRYKMVGEDRRQIIGFLVPGDVCDLSVSLLRVADHSISSLTPLTYAKLASGTLGELCAHSPEIGLAFTREALVAAAIQREWNVSLGQRTAFERLAHLFSELFHRLNLVGLTSGSSMDFPPTQTDLAAATGMTAVHVNRTLQELRNRDLIRLRGRSLTIPDLAGLEGAALFNARYLHFGSIGAPSAGTGRPTIAASPAARERSLNTQHVVSPAAPIVPG